MNGLGINQSAVLKTVLQNIMFGPKYLFGKFGQLFQKIVRVLKTFELDVKHFTPHLSWPLVWLLTAASLLLSKVLNCAKRLTFRFTHINTSGFLRAASSSSVLMIAAGFLLSLCYVRSNVIKLTWHQIQHVTWTTFLMVQVKAPFKWGAIFAVYIPICMLELFLVYVWAECVYVCVFISGFLTHAIFYIHICHHLFLSYHLFISVLHRFHSPASCLSLLLFPLPTF